MREIEEDYSGLAAAVAAGGRWAGHQRGREPGEMLRWLRRGLQLSQADLAEQAGLARTLVTRVERGGNVELATVRRLFATLGCSFVVLPASEAMAARFRALARRSRRRDREWERAVRSIRGGGQGGGP